MITVCATHETMSTQPPASVNEPAATARSTPHPSPARRVFRIGGWRRLMMPIAMSPLTLAGLALILFGGDADSLSGGMLIVFMTSVIAVLGECVMLYTRLTVSSKGVVLHQLGYRLQASWSDIEAFYDRSGREGFVVRQKMTNRGAATFAFWAGLCPEMYDDAQQELIWQRRFIPIEIFARHMDRGLRDLVLAYAPELVGERPSVGSSAMK